MLSNINFGKFALVVTLSITGCSTQRIQPSSLDIVSIKPNCHNPYQQLEWLRTLESTHKEKSSANFDNVVFGGFSKDYAYNKYISSGRHDWFVDYKIKEIYHVCQLGPK